MDRKPGKSIQESFSRIRQDAVICDFSSITNLLDEALRTRFICSINNEAVLKALFKFKDLELTFTRATETEDAARVAKETVYETGPSPAWRQKLQFLSGMTSLNQNIALKPFKNFINLKFLSKP